ncbi:response regulator transcription factor [Arthrobacter sp. ISL-65]|uniref:response regulator transcription factor n=1 Tax=Arthrobacter sp. ISL-65 TaxID=2819112 RepID=UPI001BEA7C37|nr:response regulator transcription factor [Arthrobacter sp. ISL-65]MBT2549663.1 response regulator transcription factor [Arthrobacter sp. ISL-65]
MNRVQTAVVIEDEAETRGIITLILSQSGFAVHACERGADAVEAVRSLRPELVTLDLGLPDIDGFEVARQIRVFSDTRILMVTARSREIDMLMGLESGADEYVTKPFRPRELKHRVKALMRRPRKPDNEASWPRAGTQAAGLTILEHNGLRLSPQTRRVEADGVEIALTPSEFDLLRALMEGGRTVRTGADLAGILQGHITTAAGAYRDDGASRIVPNHIGNLRRKLGESRANPRWIETARGFGYRMTPR